MIAHRDCDPCLAWRKVYTKPLNLRELRLFFYFAKNKC